MRTLIILALFLLAVDCLIQSFMTNTRVSNRLTCLERDTVYIGDGFCADRELLPNTK